MKQSEIFMEGEGAAWLARNQAKLPPDYDPVADLISRNKIEPKAVMEVGCADGWRLDNLEFEFGCKTWGVDPGIPKSGEPSPRRNGTAYLLPFIDRAFDLVIYGFCLYLCDREDLFQIAREGDRVLKDSGFLVIHDFHSDIPHSRKYKHKEGILSYKMDYSKLWLGNPAYGVFARSIHGSGDDATSVTILRKRLSVAWPTHE